jgi:hypothetical protein
MAKKIEKESVKDEVVSDEIVVRDPLELRPVSLPLVITLPEGASKAQIEYAKVLNAYAYKNPVKWETKKAKEIAKLKSLKNAPDPVEDTIKYKNALSS